MNEVCCFRIHVFVSIRAILSSAKPDEESETVLNDSSFRFFVPQLRIIMSGTQNGMEMLF